MNKNEHKRLTTILSSNLNASSRIDISTSQELGMAILEDALRLEERMTSCHAFHEVGGW
jgi:hypothetical protein